MADSRNGSNLSANQLADAMWTYHVNDEVNFDISETTIYKPVGHFYEDCVELANSLGVVLHPMLKKRTDFTAAVNESQDLGELEEELEVEGNVTPEITELEILSHKFDYANGRVLAQALPFSQIKLLKFNGCDLSARELDVVVESLFHESNKVHSFCFEFNPLDWSIEENAAPILKLVSKPSPLENLSLRGCGVTGSLLQAMLENVRENQTLTYLNISRAEVDDDSVEHVLNIIKESKSLAALDLSYTHITQACIPRFIEILGKHPFPEEEVDAHLKKEKERDQLVEKNKKAKNSKKPVEEFVPKVDPIENIEGEGWFMWRNPNLRHINISFNELGDAAGSLVSHFVKKTKEATITAYQCRLSERELKKYKKESRVKIS